MTQLRTLGGDIYTESDLVLCSVRLEGVDSHLEIIAQPTQVVVASAMNSLVMSSVAFLPGCTSLHLAWQDSTHPLWQWLSVEPALVWRLCPLCVPSVCRNSLTDPVKTGDLLQQVL